MEMRENHYGFCVKFASDSGGFWLGLDGNWLFDQISSFLPAKVIYGFAKLAEIYVN
jgi:hypothetical protein